MACARGYDWQPPPDVKEASRCHTLSYASDELSEDYALWSRAAEMVFVFRGCAVLEHSDRVLGRG
eukprot:3290904-Pyramimonas_sp.AAC.1